MIPKKIHYCWLSNNDFPDLIRRCIDSWKRNLPDYEFILWDTNKFPLEKNIWVRQAFENKKYAFAADYIRLYAVYNYGGIYLDTDVEVVKNLDELLHLPYFMGSEGDGIIEAGVFGAEKYCDWLGDCIEYYNGRTFLKKDGSFDTLTLPRIMMKQIQKKHTITLLKKNDIKNLSYSKDKELYMFPSDFFCAKNHGTGIIEKTDNTYTIHHFAMSWISPKDTLLPNIKRKLMKILGVNFVNNMINLFCLREVRSFFKKKK